MKTVYLLMGVSASGKSTWARRFSERFSDSIIISRDAVRFSLVKEGDAYFSKEKKVFKNFINLVSEAITNEINNVIVDATHLNAASRAKVLNEIKPLIMQGNYKVIIMHITSDAAVARDKKRSGREQVGEKVIHDQLARLEPVSNKEKEYYAQFFPIEYNVIEMKG